MEEILTIAPGDSREIEQVSAFRHQAVEFGPPNFRVRVPDGKEEDFLEVPFPLTGWPFTVTADGAVIVLREHGRSDVYSLFLSVQ